MTGRTLARCRRPSPQSTRGAQWPVAASRAAAAALKSGARRYSTRFGVQEHGARPERCFCAATQAAVPEPWRCPTEAVCRGRPLVVRLPGQLYPGPRGCLGPVERLCRGWSRGSDALGPIDGQGRLQVGVTWCLAPN